MRKWLAILMLLAGGIAPRIPEGFELPACWVSFDGVTMAPAEPQVSVLSSSASELVLRILTPGVVSDSLEVESDEYRRLSLPGYGATRDVGHPELPVIGQLVAVPLGCDIALSTAYTESIRYWMPLVYPAPAETVRHTEDGYAYIDEVFSLDEDAYNSRGLSPDNVASAEIIGSIRGQGVALLTVHPIRFDPEYQEIRILPSVDITLSFNGGSGGVSGDLGPLDSIARREFSRTTRDRA